MFNRKTDKNTGTSLSPLDPATSALTELLLILHLSLGPPELLDEDEQDREIKGIQDLATQNVNQSRTLFSYIFYGMGVMYSVVLIYSVSNPFDMSHQAVFKSILSDNVHIFHVFYIVSIIVCIGSAYIVQVGMDKLNKWIQHGVLCSAICTLLGWSLVFIFEVVDNFLLFWMPLANIATVLMAFYVDSTNTSTLKDAEKIKDLKYRYKKV